ncbi:microtubule-associated protein 1S [Ochotona curzoniae]|uniref:microtubule-associated protein 1S n=1 Tax=Ochotona curzoniae TaxID=130825 RepID=UPI001B352970|nr:microtubule-associated protein 1S [Ochotona curzoniae]
MAATVAPVPSSLLLVVGCECTSPGQLAYVLQELERGLRSWGVDDAVCSLDKQLGVFLSLHSTTFSSIVKGQRSLHHRGDTLETLVLLNPSDKSLCDELRNLLLDPAPHKLLVLAGPCLEGTGELLLQTGGFSSHHFLQVLEDQEILDILASTPMPADTPTLTITCPTFGNWAQLAPALPGLQAALRLRQLWLNPPMATSSSSSSSSEGLSQFLEYMADFLEPLSPFELLEPQTSSGFLRLTRPCCYVFPGGLGDAAAFAIHGFTVLVNGGSNPRSTFWKLVRYLDRVDAMLVTHAGADSLPGLNSLLRRKLAERHQVAASGGGSSGCSSEDPLRFISPILGIAFLNASKAATRLVGGEDEAELALGLLAQLGIPLLPLRRGPQPAEPLVLYENLGLGRLDLYVLHPPAAGGGGGGGSSSEQAQAASVCALLVWRPVSSADKVVRVLFPGCTPPARILDGLSRLQHLGFLREPVVTRQDLDKPQRANSNDSLASRDGARKEGRVPAPARSTQERPGTATRKELTRVEASRRTEKEVKPPSNVKKDPKAGTTPKPQAQSQPREARRTLSATNSLKKAGAPASSKPLRRAAPTPQSPENGPRNPPGACRGEASPPTSATSGSPGPAPAVPASQGNPGELGLSPVVEERGAGRDDKSLELLLSASTMRPRTPEPTDETHPSPAGEASPTLTTPSLPAEVGSPHSTEVDESLSVSFEQVLPPPSATAATGEAGLSLPLRGPPRARRSASPHDVDLCLVSPCEFEHRKVVPSAPAPASPGSSNDSSARSQEWPGLLGPAETPPTSVSESLPTLSDSDPLPSATATAAATPAAVDSDDDTEALEGRDSIPKALKAPLPSVCRVQLKKSTPQSETVVHASMPTRTAPARPSSVAATRKAGPAAVAKTKGLAPSGDQASRPLSARSEASDKGARAPLSRKPSVPKMATRTSTASAGSRLSSSATPTNAPFYLDLVYLPGGSSARLVGQEFFRRVRATYYVLSGQDQAKEEGMRALLDALLAGKQQWDRELQVTLVPTFDSAAMHTWYEETHSRHQALGVTVLGSNSMVCMEGESYLACKLEF